MIDHDVGIIYEYQGDKNHLQSVQCSPIESEDISICCGLSLVGKFLHNHGVQGKEKLYSIVFTDKKAIDLYTILEIMVPLPPQAQTACDIVDYIMHALICSRAH